MTAAQRRHPRLELSLLSFSELAVQLTTQPAAIPAASRATQSAASTAAPQVLSEVAVTSHRSQPCLAEGSRQCSVDGSVEVVEGRIESSAAGDAAAVDLLALDGLIVRTMPVGSLEQVIFRMDALQAVEQAGVPVLNPPRALEIAIDKWLTLQRLSRAGIATPPTWACQTRATAMEAYEALGGDVVLKPIFGGEGRGLMRLSDADMAWRVFGTLQQLGNVLYVQQFMPHFGYDIRVLLVGERLLSIKRRAATGGWRTNISQGCSAEPHQLTPREEELARAAARVTGGSLLGIDLLPTLDGRTVVLEVNAVPGWKGTAAALGIDVADLVIAHLEDLHVQRS
jgi:ribosomal protein S6--L-glutamate ligase